MRMLTFDLSMFSEGFITASNIRPDEPLNEGRERLYEWAFGSEKEK